jgi:mono/diheme cytochrome c family protein
MTASHAPSPGKTAKKRIEAGRGKARVPAAPNPARGVKKIVLKRSLAAGLAAALMAFSGLSGAAEIPNLARGRALYENHCQVCHTPNIHSRPNRLPLGANELRQIVIHWSKQENLRWGAEEVTDVVFYLQQTRYKF